MINKEVTSKVLTFYNEQVALGIDITLIGPIYGHSIIGKYGGIVQDLLKSVTNVVYVAYDNSAIVYVGITTEISVVGRISQHHALKDKEDLYFYLLVCSHKEDVAILESLAIEQLDPLRNKKLT